jgi:hypothetical protein
LKNKFTDREWELLKQLHFQVFGLVAGSDGVIDRKERAVLERQLRSGELVSNPLHRRLLTDILKEDVRGNARPTISSPILTPTGSLKDLLRDRLTDSEYHDFINSLFAFGLEVARASGGGPLGLTGPISPEEDAALNAFAVEYELDSDSLRRRLGIRRPGGR